MTEPTAPAPEVLSNFEFMENLEKQTQRAREAVIAQRKGTGEPYKPLWPHRYRWVDDLGGYVVWRDVFEGQMKCTLDAAIRTHRVATFVTESEARDYCEYRNSTFRPDL